MYLIRVLAHPTFLRFYWLNHGIDVTFLNSPSINATRLGMSAAFRMSTGRSDKDIGRLPISIDMILGLQRSWVAPITIQQLAVYTAMVLGYTTLARVSEYLPPPIRTRPDKPAPKFHAILTEAIVFTARDSVTSRPFLVPAYGAALPPWSSITGCIITFPSAKNDKRGKGHRYNFTRQSVEVPVRLYDITSDLWTYVVAARPVRGKPFFFLPTAMWTLRPAYLTAELKSLASLFGLDPSRTRPHSIRIGGASALAAAGLPDYVIKEMGGWKSLAFLLYIRATAQTFSTAQEALSNSLLFSAEVIKATHPSVQIA